MPVGGGDRTIKITFRCQQDLDASPAATGAKTRVTGLEHLIILSPTGVRCSMGGKVVTGRQQLPFRCESQHAFTTGELPGQGRTVSLVRAGRCRATLEGSTVTCELKAEFRVTPLSL